MITRPARLSTASNQLNIIIESEGDYTIPIEDVNSLVVESGMVQLSSHAISQLAINGCAVFFCDDKHMPCCIAMPYSSHSRKLKVLHNQLNIKKPLQKQLWRQIVQQKIINQSLCLKLCNRDGAVELFELHKKVLSGDSGYMEARVAAKYFKLLFGGGFKRYNKQHNICDDTMNSALNYGYSIIRGAIARTLVVYGFEPCLGIFHHNETNQFNLADDLLEPFRPIVDYYVFNKIEGDALTPQHKAGLVGILNYEAKSGNEFHSVMYAVERMVKSLSSVYQGSNGKILLPELCFLRVHEYE